MTAPHPWLVPNGHPDPESNDPHDCHEQPVPGLFAPAERGRRLDRGGAQPRPLVGAVRSRIGAEDGERVGWAPRRVSRHELARRPTPLVGAPVIRDEACADTVLTRPARVQPHATLAADKNDSPGATASKSLPKALGRGP